ncbi:MAG TPA: hypothetical protein VFR70_11295 [Flavobacterium sp.]|nr:hypothetical protein [Flavobacterium sp.]
MKIIFLFASLLFLALGSSEAYSQYYGDSGGVNRSIGSGVRQNKPKKDKEKKTDYAQDYVQYLDKELKLDGLQQAAIASMINDSKDSLEEISKSSMPDQEKKDRLRAISDKISDKILKLLSPAQKEKYLKMKEETDKRALKN